MMVGFIETIWSAPTLPALYVRQTEKFVGQQYPKRRRAALAAALHKKRANRKAYD
jgi:hypothetical protein